MIHSRKAQGSQLLGGLKGVMPFLVLGFILLMWIQMCDEREERKEAQKQMIQACQEAGGTLCPQDQCLGNPVGTLAPGGMECCTLACGQSPPATNSSQITNCQKTCSEDSDCTSNATCSEGNCYSFTNSTCGIETNATCAPEQVCQTGFCATVQTSSACNQEQNTSEFAINPDLGSANQSCSSQEGATLCSGDELCPEVNGVAQRMQSNDDNAYCCAVACTSRIQATLRVAGYGEVIVEKLPNMYLVWYGDTGTDVGSANYVRATLTDQEQMIYEFTIPNQQLEQFQIINNADEGFSVGYIARLDTIVT